MKSITDFGIFVGVDEGIDGLVHVSDLHWTKKVKHPSELYKKGDDVEAVVLGIDVDNERISLGIKQLRKIRGARAEALPGRRPRARRGHQRHRLRRLRRDRGGLEGLIHVSQLSTERVDQPSQLFKVGDEVEAEVTRSTPREKRIGSRIKALRRSEERDEVDATCGASARARKFSFEDILSEELASIATRASKAEHPRGSADAGPWRSWHPIARDR